MKKSEIEKKYNEIIAYYEKDETINLTNRVNCYRCNECGHITKTRDIDKGVTPFMHLCEKCNGMAFSSFYEDIVPNQQPTQEWYRPRLKKVYNMSDAMIEHILNGGLDVRTISKSNN